MERDDGDEDRGEQGARLLMEAAGRGDREAVRRLLKSSGAHVNVNAADRHGWTALLAAVEGRHVDVVKLLLDAGADVHHVTRVDGMNALHVLAEQSQRDFAASDADETEERKAADKLFDLLLDAGVDPNVANRSGETVLHLLCLRGNVGSVKVLLSRKLVTDINATNKHGDTVLHYAARKGYGSIVDLLVAQGASATVEGVFGTPTQVAREFRQEAVAELLRELCQASSPEGQVGLWSLPPEVLLHMLSYLGNPRDLCSVSRVCRALAAVGRDDALWQSLGNEAWLEAGHVSEGWKAAYMKWLRAAVELYRSNNGCSATPAPCVSPSTGQPSDHDFLMKLILSGDMGAGKTSLMVQYVQRKFHSNYRTTIGVDFLNHIVNWHGKRVKLQIWDTAGPERFQTISRVFYRGAHVVLLIYDTTRRATLDGARRFKAEIEQSISEEVRVVLVGTKTDLADKRAVSYEEAQQQASEWAIPYVECSSKTGDGIDGVFLTAVSLVMGGWRHVAGMGTPAVVPDEAEVASAVRTDKIAADDDDDEKKDKEWCNVQ